MRSDWLKGMKNVQCSTVFKLSKINNLIDIGQVTAQHLSCDLIFSCPVTEFQNISSVEKYQ